MEAIIYIIIFIIVSGLIMVGTNILYDLAAAVIPLITVFMIGVGIVVGFGVALKNTVTVYGQVFFKRGK